MSRFKTKPLLFGLFIVFLMAGYLLWRGSEKSVSDSVPESVQNQAELNEQRKGNSTAGSSDLTTDASTSSEAQESSQGVGSPPTEQEAALSEAEKLHRDYVKEPPRFESMSDSTLQDFLKMYTLGSGAEFLQNVDNFTQSLKDSSRAKQFERLVSQELLGKFRSRFLTSGPQAQSPDYQIEVHFKSESIELKLVKDSVTYYQAEIARPREEVRTSTSRNLPVNLLLKFPAKLEYGYRHPLYLQLFISYSREQLVGNFYLTNQSEETPLYFLSEEMAFDKVSL